MHNISIVIPTYKRTHLLILLLKDILQQTLRVGHFIIVDGDSNSGEVRNALSSMDLQARKLVYIPSNHGNLAYQRYLGWRAAAEQGANVIVYFDDDQRIYQRDVLEWLAKPLLEDNGVVGVGCYIRFPTHGYDPAISHLTVKKKSHWLVKRFGSQRTLDLKPGQLTPVGHRIRLEDDGCNYLETDWLRGGNMVYRMSAISREVFSDDLFALTHIHCGLGEDTFLSRRVGVRGKLLYTFRAVVDHPHADTPKAYPFEAYKYAYAATYSRRFLNDHYRVYAEPTRADRWALVKSYVGNTLLAWMRVARKPTKTNLALARGTTLGAIHGLTRPPTAKRLTPDIDWWGDAEMALSGAITIRHGELTPDS